jgi:hypothetical protein
LASTEKPGMIRTSPSNYCRRAEVLHLFGDDVIWAFQIPLTGTPDKLRNTHAMLPQLCFDAIRQSFREADRYFPPEGFM